MAFASPLAIFGLFRVLLKLCPEQPEPDVNEPEREKRG